MNAIKQRGDSARNLAKTYSEIADISRAGYISNSNMMEQGRTNMLRATNGESLISNADTGETYQVTSGSKHYWMNNNGEYIGTDNALFDPRTNNTLNSMEWSKFKLLN